jgi:hypothetical protein
MNPLFTLWESSIQQAVEPLGARSYALGKLWHRPAEKGWIIRCSDGPLKLEVFPPEKVQVGNLLASGMRVLLHFPQARRLRPIMLDYGEPKSESDVQEAVQSLLKVVREHMEHAAV